MNNIDMSEITATITEIEKALDTCESSIIEAYSSIQYAIELLESGRTSKALEILKMLSELLHDDSQSN